MARRLLKTHGGRGLYKYTHPEVCSWESWEQLPPVPDVDPALKLLAEQAGPKVTNIGGLYGGDPNRDAERRRRRVDALLEARGVRPRARW